MANSENEIVSEGFFPTFVHQQDLAEPEELNASLLKSIRELRGADPKGEERSNQPGLGGWHSASDLQRDPRFKPLCDRISDAMKTISSRLNLDPNSRLLLLEMWSILNPPGSYNRAHIHPSTHFSGVYYVQVPPNAGPIIFMDPRLQAQILPLALAPGADKHRAHRRSIPVIPRAGRLVIFPSWLMHAVEPNLTELTGPDADRVIVSFNVGQTSLK